MRQLSTLAAALCVLLAAFFSTPTAAADNDAVSATLSAFRVVVRPDGKTGLDAAAGAQPGDTIEYRVVYRNTSRGAAKNVIATLPVPAGGLAYLPSSAQPKAVLASLDGQAFAPVPLMRKVTLPDGTLSVQRVPASEYRALRWQLGDLPAGTGVTVSARMRLATDAVAVAAAR